ncbi:MAG: glycosyltransferase [Saprospiraceae bacterium]|nr:glycosyltransferase [Saprospiraceae bacterium]
MESLFPKENKTIFTFIGRLLYDKGINEFVEAAKILKGKRQDCSFWIVGELDPGKSCNSRQRRSFEMGGG